MNKEKVKKILIIIVLAIVSVFLCVITINRIKYFSYNESKASLVSYGKIEQNTEYNNTCKGTFEYFVNDKKYEASFTIDSQYCFKDYEMTIYYDSNNPNNVTNDRSIFMLLIVILFDIFSIGGLFVMIKELFKKSNNKTNSNVTNNDEEKKQLNLNHSIYGKYELVYDTSNVSNKFGKKGIKCLDLSFEEKPSDCIDLNLEIYINEDKITNFINSNQMNNVLDLYHKNSSKYLDRIIDALINQEMDKLSNWYNVPNSLEGKSLIKDKKVLLIHGFTVDEKLNIDSISCSYNYKDDDVATFLFSYDLNKNKVEDVDISS